MSERKPKVSERDGHLIHHSVGAILVDGGKILLEERATPPSGWAGIAGHVDEGETPFAALQREVSEETGLVVSSAELLREEYVAWNWCDAEVTGHHWHLYQISVTGFDSLRAEPGEVLRLTWYSVDELSNLPLEEVWRYWFEVTGYLK